VRRECQAGRRDHKFAREAFWRARPARRFDARPRGAGEQHGGRLEGELEPALRLHAQVKAEAMARDLCVYPMDGTLDGRGGDHVLLAPPFIVTDAELEQIVACLHDAIEAALAPARARGEPGYAADS
jgi:hypothetical protein